MRCAAVLAPALVQTGQAARARAIVEETLAARPPGFSGARLRMVLAWLLREEGDESGSVAELAGAWEEAGDQARYVVHREWPRVERPLWAALEQQAVDPVAAVGAVADAVRVPVIASESVTNRVLCGCWLKNLACPQNSWKQLPPQAFVTISARPANGGKKPSAISTSTHRPSLMKAISRLPNPGPT